MSVKITFFFIILIYKVGRGREYSLGFRIRRLRLEICIFVILGKRDFSRECVFLTILCWVFLI